MNELPRSIARSVARPVWLPVEQGVNNSIGGGAPALDYVSFVLDGALQSPTTLTRAGAGTMFDSSLLLVSAGTNVAREHNYDNVSTLERGVLIESSATNFCLHSNDQTNAAWVKTNMTVAKNEVGLDGNANTACTLTATAANATCLQSFVHASGTRCGSIYISRKTGTGNIDVTVDNGVTWITMGTVDGLFRRHFTAQAALTNGVFGIRIVDSGDEIIVDGGQYETPAGTSAWVPSSYIPTTTGSVSRAADVLINAAYAFGTEGMIYFEGDVYAGDGSSCTLVYPSDNTTNNRIAMQRTTTRTIECDTFSGGVRTAVPTTAATINGVKFKVVYGWKLNDFAISLNGAAVVTDVLGATPVGMNEYAVGNILTGGSELRGCVLNLRYYFLKKTNAEIVTLATL